jgi:hypothetical protein
MKLKLLPFTMALVVSMFAAKADAASIVFDLNFAYTSDATPNSTPPWLTFTFRDAADCSPGPCAPNTVQLLMASSLESSSEFFTQTNFNSSSPLTNVAFTNGTGAFAPPTIGQYSSNAYNAGASQDFDVQVAFETSGMGGGALRFNAFDTALFTITGAGITANTFNVGTPNNPPLWASAHLQGITGTGNCNGSAWVADVNGSAPGGGSGSCGGTSVPDSGSTVALLGLAMMGVAYLRRHV